MFKIRSINFLKGFFILVTIGIVAAYGCSPQRDSYPWAESFLSGETCEAPCWSGLQPGLSSESDVYTVLKALAFVEKDSISERPYTNLGDQAKAIEFVCSPSQNKNCSGSIKLNDNMVKFIDLFIYYSLSISKAVDQLGDPQFITYAPSSVDGPPGCFFSLYWAEKQVQLTSNLKQDCPPLNEMIRSAKIDPDWQVDTLTYGYTRDSWPLYDDGKGLFIPWQGFRK